MIEILSSITGESKDNIRDAHLRICPLLRGLIYRAFLREGVSLNDIAECISISQSTIKTARRKADEVLDGAILKGNVYSQYLPSINTLFELRIKINNDNVKKEANGLMLGYKSGIPVGVIRNTKENYIPKPRPPYEGNIKKWLATCDYIADQGVTHNSYSVYHTNYNLAE